MASLFSLPNVRNHTSRNGFDMSCKNAFTAKAGELLPVYWKFVLPGDKWNLRVQHFTRTPSVQTAAFTRIKEDFSAYFVPLRLLWRYFPTAINKLYKQVPFASSLTVSNTMVDGKLPYMSLAEMLSIINKHGSNNVDEVGLSSNYQACKLLNYLGYMYVSDEYCRQVNSGTIPANPFRVNLNVSPFPLLAYQKIYQDFYRFTQWEDLNSSAYNIDYIADSGNTASAYDFLAAIPTGTGYDSIVTDGIFTLRYANWRKDVFTGIFPNSQFGDVSLLDSPVTADGFLSTTVDIPSSRLRATNGGTRVNVGVKLGDGTSSISFDNGLVPSPGSGIESEGASVSAAIAVNDDKLSAMQMRAQTSILDLRKALATQKIREITQAHDLTISAQQKAHWNVDLPDTLSNECRFLGNITSDIDINEVVNQNLYGSDNNGRATIAGKGVGIDDSRLGSYEAKEYGIIMVLYHSTPILDYEAIGTDLQLVKTNVDDFPIPEYDKLGLDTIPNTWLCNSDSVPFTGAFKPTYGWLPRYMDFKASIDLVRGEFLQTLKSWVAPVSRDVLKNTWFKITDPTYKSFKVNPSVLNPIFGMEVANGTESDQFYVNCYIDCKVQRNLDYSGMPY